MGNGQDLWRTNQMKTCVSCIHFYKQIHNAPQCERPVGKLEPIWGQEITVGKPCRKEREGGNCTRCGPLGKFWKRKLSFWEKYFNVGQGRVRAKL